MPPLPDQLVLDWLLEEDNPSVRYFTLRDLVGPDLASAQIHQARQAIMQSGPVPAILGKQNPDGSWDLPEKFYASKYQGTVWTLLVLAELAADPADERIQRACEFILNHSRDPDSGGFSYQMSVRTGEGLPSGIIPCLTGNMVYSLIQLGYLDDPRVQMALHWIITRQRADDGETSPPSDPYYKRYTNCFGRHSCHMGVAKALKALAAVPEAKRTPEISAKIDELADYFLKHQLYRKSHDLSQMAKPGWLRLGFPLMYNTDILELLGIFTSLGRYDARLDDALAVLASKQQPDGRWLLENTFNGKMQVRIEQKGKPSKWITLKAWEVLRAFSSLV
ncbi:MAG: nitrogen fixation protein NifH [Clostridia bacterium]|nr:nitrogen fixation protein NifH [Clostridia bacterium]